MEQNHLKRNLPDPLVYFGSHFPSFLVSDAWEGGYGVSQEVTAGRG